MPFAHAGRGRDVVHGDRVGAALGDQRAGGVEQAQPVACGVTALLGCRRDRQRTHPLRGRHPIHFSSAGNKSDCGPVAPCDDPEHDEGTSDMADIKVLVLLGSLRAASINRQLAELAAESAPDGVGVTIYEGLGELPFYNEDLDTDAAPPPWWPCAPRPPRRRGAGRHAGVQRQHPGRAEERHRLAVAALRQRRAEGQAAGRHRRGARPVRRVWAHDETRKSFGIAGPRVVDSVKLSLQTTTFDGRHPRRAPRWRPRSATWSESSPPKLAERVGSLLAGSPHPARAPRSCRWPVIDLVAAGVARRVVSYDTPDANRTEPLRPGNFRIVIQNIWYLF